MQERESNPNAPPNPVHGWGTRRSFVGGLILGGACGALSTWGLYARHIASESEVRDATSIGPEFDALDHDRFMRAAIVEAEKAPRAPFGAVIVRAATSEVVAEGHNRSRVSPTYHGEIDVINRCAQLHPNIDWKQLALYTTAEPCPMCQSAIMWAGIRMVVYGSSIPFLKSVGWNQVDIRAAEVIRRTPFNACALHGGVLEERCNALFRGIH